MGFDISLVVCWQIKIPRVFALSHLFCIELSIAFSSLLNDDLQMLLSIDSHWMVFDIIGKWTQITFLWRLKGRSSQYSRIDCCDMPIQFIAFKCDNYATKHQLKLESRLCLPDDQTLLSELETTEWNWAQNTVVQPN